MAIELLPTSGIYPGSGRRRNHINQAKMTGIITASVMIAQAENAILVVTPRRGKDN